jgi:hypothetical protein
VKVRASLFPDVHDAVLFFDRLIDPLKRANIQAIEDPVEWEIHLTNVNELKASVLKADLPIVNGKKELLLEELPRFVWIANAVSNGRPALSLLFDATDVQQGRFFLRPIEYDTTLAQVMRAFAKLLATQPINTQPSHVWRIFNWFANQT